MGERSSLALKKGKRGVHWLFCYGDERDAAPRASRPSERLQEAFPLQALEGNPLTEGELAMFEMFEREGWSHERRRDYILAQFKAASASASAAE